MTATVTLAVLAKAPRAGHSKTRLCPPCTPAQAAALATAALQDTLDAVLATTAYRSVLVLDGEPGPWLPDNLQVIPQRGDGLAERLAAAFADLDGPALVIGMDTPQVTPQGLTHAMDTLAAGTPAVLGPADDGGYWAIGLRASDPALFLGVPMSETQTGAVQLARLREHGRDPYLLDGMRDVDRFEDALAVAALAPGSRFARAVAAVAAKGTATA